MDPANFAAAKSKAGAAPAFGFPKIKFGVDQYLAAAPPQLKW